MKSAVWIICITLIVGALPCVGHEECDEDLVPGFVPTVVMSEETQAVHELADKPYRPHWAPLPLLWGDTGGVALLHQLLSSQDAVIRARSALLLGSIGCPDSVGPLVKHLDDPNRDVRVQSGIALARMGDPRGIPVCAAVLGDAPSWVRYYAAYGLWCIDTPRARAVLKKHASDSDPLVGPAVRDALKTSRVLPPNVPRLTKNAQPVAAPPDQVWVDAVDVLLTEADWWWHAGNYDQSVRCLETAVFFGPNNIDHYSSIAWLLWSMGRDPAAVRALDRAIAVNPTDPDSHFELGHHYFKTKRFQLALSPLNRSVELGGDHRVRRTYAHCLEKLGRLDESVAQWTAIVEVDPSDEPARYNLERVKTLIEECTSSR